MYFKPITSNKVPGIRSYGDRMGRALFNKELLTFYDSVINQPVTIRLADDNCHRNDANILLNRMYSWRGYGDHHEIAESPSHTTFTASSNEGLLGTITLAVDSANGLAADELFKDVIDEFRARPGANVCELTKFAFETTKPSKPMLASLFHLIFIYGQHAYGCTDVFIEVNPRHVRFYEHMLGFKRIGDLKDNTSVAAPAQLMWLSVAHIRDQIDEHAGQGVGASTRSLYAYFFSPREEEGLYTSMVTAPAAQGYVRVGKVASQINVAPETQQHRHTAIKRPPCGCELHNHMCVGAAEMALKQANVKSFVRTGKQQ
jgi:hypothetical protein